MSSDEAMAADRTLASATSLAKATDLVHQRSRLAIMAVLYELGESEFGLVRRITKLTDGNLSRHVQILEEAGLVSVRKGYVGKRPKTWIELSDDGYGAFEHELHILRTVVDAGEARKSARAGRRPKRQRSRQLADS